LAAPKSLVGESIRRLEDSELIRGEARYVDDLPLPGALCVAFVRSPLGHARVRNLSLDKAKAMPGVVAVFGPGDLPALSKPIPPMSTVPGIKERGPCAVTGVVRAAGDVVAVVVADDPYQAADAEHAVEVDYDELPVVVTTDAAMQDGASLVHEDVPENKLADIKLAVETGDIESAFQQADIVIRDHFNSRRVSNASIETRGVAAQPGGKAEGVVVTVWSSTQAPQTVRNTVSAALGLSMEQVDVITPHVGGGFGPKGRSYREEVALGALALHLGKPCRWQATRREDFLSTCQGHAVSADFELAARSDGTILGLRGCLVQDTGAYMIGPLIPPQFAAEHLLGPYHVPAADVEIIAAYTNKAQLSPIRGGGREQGVFIIERLMDHLARKIGVDPLEVRRRNLIQPHEFPYHTQYQWPGGGTIVYDSGDFPAYLAEAQMLVGYEGVRAAQPGERQAGKYRGVGVTTFVESTSFGEEGARVEVRDDGSVSLTLGSPDTGQSHSTVMRQICASELGVALESIEFVSGDTHAMEVGTGTMASRFAVMGGNATMLAAQQVRARARVAGGWLLDETPQSVELCDGTVRVTNAPDHTVKLGDVARTAREAGFPLDVTHIFAPDTATTWAGGAFGAVVEVDVETGLVTVEKLVAVHDTGKEINPGVVKGIFHGAMAMGLGEALGEMLAYDDHGKLLTDSFNTYLVPRADQVPSFIVQAHPCRTTNNPAGIKGCGEMGVIGTLPTIVAAVEDALAPLQLTLNDLPIRSEDLARMCEPLRRKVPEPALGGRQ
jgi:aerobic carbon-monoxide dehydrogenase large subunit